MIKKFLSASIFVWGFLSFQSVALAQTEYIYQLAHQQNTNALQKIRLHLGTLDYPNSQGQTPLCLSVHRNNYRAFSTLTKLGANRRHFCMQKIPSSQRAVFNKGYKIYYQKATNSFYAKNTPQQKSSFISTPTAITIASIAGIGGLVALAGGGGGGGSSNSSSNKSTENNQNDITNDLPPQTDDNISNDKPIIDVNPPSTVDPVTPPSGNDSDSSNELPTNTTYQLSASDFETAEYSKGNFLRPIKAAEAYASVFTATKSSDGSIEISDNLSPISVAIIDTGIYNHNDLPSVKKSYNFDYGPCQSSTQKNCWIYKNGFAFRDASGEEEILYQGTDFNKEAFEDFKKAYDSSYVWENNQSLYTPLNDIHGTHVTGIISAKKNNSGIQGVAPNAELMIMRYDFLSGLSKPLIKAVDEGAKVINLSLGTPADSDYNATIHDWNFQMEYNLDGFNYLADKKSAVLVVAAGNENYHEPTMEAGAGLHIDGLDEVMISVVATKASNPKERASYSNKCGSTAAYCLAAPGGDTDLGIASTTDKNQIQYAYGTSMATPVVSGAAAFLWGTYPNLTASEVAKILLETATPINNKEIDSEFGNGLLNLYDAINKPLGEISVATTQNINDSKIKISNTKLRLPSQLKTQILKALPQSISVLDKYDRSFKITTNNLVKSAYHNPDAFKNKLRRFSSFKTKKHIQTSPHISFGFVETAQKDSVYGIGEMDISFNFDKNKIRFYFKEETKSSADSPSQKGKINPFAQMNNAYGIEETFKISSKLNLKTSFTTGENAFYETNIDKDDSFDKQAFSFDTELNYQPINSIALGFSAGTLYEKDSLLGLNGSGAFDIKNTQTYYMGVNATLNPFADLFLSGSYFYGMTKAKRQNAFLETSDLYSDGFAFDAYYKLSPDNYLGLSLVSPLRINKGNAYFDLPTGRDYYSDTVYRKTYKATLKPSARELDYSLYYGKKINPLMSFKMQGGVRVHPDHQKDADNDYQLLFGFDWKFN